MQMKRSPSTCDCYVIVDLSSRLVGFEASHEGRAWVRTFGESFKWAVERDFQKGTSETLMDRC